MIKQTKGITLIALIITIIILIILTAVTINNVIGTDLIGFATKAVGNYTDSAKDEADKVDKLVGTLDNQGVGEGSAVRAGQIVEKTEKDNYTDAQGRHATIPEGFKVSTKSSEQYIKDGLVIQDNDGNEFVWVPCYYGETKPVGTAEDVQQYKSHSYEKNDDTSGPTVEKNGDGWKTYCYTNYEDWFDETVEKRDETTGAITKDESAYGNDSVKKYGGFYIARYEAGWDETTVEKLNEEESKTDYITTGWEQEKIKKNDNVVNKKPISKPNVFAWNFISQQTALDVASKMYEKSETEGRTNSYLVDGTAWDTITNWIAADNVDATNSTTYGNYLDNDSNYTGWYAEHVWGGQKNGQFGGVTEWLYAKHFTNGSIKLQLVRLSENNLWENKEGNYTNYEKADISKNYLDTRIEIPTGSYDGFKLKNIYDLAGNMWEWTTEVGKHDTTNGSSFAVLCGGCFNNGGTTTPLCYRDGGSSSSDTMNVDLGFRVVLYIK